MKTGQQPEDLLLSRAQSAVDNATPFIPKVDRPRIVQELRDRLALVADVLEVIPDLSLRRAILSNATITPDMTANDIAKSMSDEYDKIERLRTNK